MDAESATRERPDGETILDLLGDPDCRAILGATSEAALTVAEIADRCDVSSSTAYRKTDRLKRTPLLEERLRLLGDGGYGNEYRSACRGVTVAVADGRDVAVDLSKERTG